MKCNQSCPGIELVSPCPYPVTITITPRAPPTWWSAQKHPPNTNTQRIPENQGLVHLYLNDIPPNQNAAQGHLIAGSHARTMRDYLNALSRQQSPFLGCVRRQAMDTVLPSRYFLKGSPLWNHAVSPITPTQHERPVDPGKPVIGVFKILQCVLYITKI